MNLIDIRTQSVEGLSRLNDMLSDENIDMHELNEMRDLLDTTKHWVEKVVLNMLENWFRTKNETEYNTFKELLESATWRKLPDWSWILAKAWVKLWDTQSEILNNDSFRWIIVKRDTIELRYARRFSWKDAMLLDYDRYWRAWESKWVDHEHDTENVVDISANRAEVDSKLLESTMESISVKITQSNEHVKKELERSKDTETRLDDQISKNNQSLQDGVLLNIDTIDSHVDEIDSTSETNKSAIDRLVASILDNAHVFWDERDSVLDSYDIYSKAWFESFIDS